MEDDVALELWRQYIPCDWDKASVAESLGGEVIHAAHRFVKHFVEVHLSEDERRQLVRAILHRVMPILDDWEEEE